MNLKREVYIIKFTKTDDAMVISSFLHVYEMYFLFIYDAVIGFCLQYLYLQINLSMYTTKTMYFILKFREEICILSH